MPKKIARKKIARISLPLAKHLHFRNPALLAAVTITALVGVYVVARLLAAGVVAFEADAGSLTGTIAVKTGDSTAAGGAYITFGATNGGTTPPPPPVQPPPPPPVVTPPPPPPPAGGNFASRKCTTGNIGGATVLNSGGNFSAAVSGLGNGGILVVKPGNYSAGIDLGSKSNFTVCADPAGGRPVISGGMSFSGASNVHIEGLEIAGNGGDAGINLSWGSTNVSAWDNWVHGFTQCGICFAAASGKIDVRYNRVWDNSHTSCYGGSGISTWAFSNGNAGNNSDGYNSYIIGNVLWDNYQSVPSTCIGANTITDGNCIIIDAMDGSQGGLGGSTDQFAGRFLISNNVCANNGGRCINVFSSQRVDIFNNTCYHNATTQSTSGNAEIAAVYANDVRISNNIVVASAGAAYGEYNASGISISNNIWNGNGASVHGSGDKVTDPQLTNAQLNAGSGDWRPRSGSPAIGAGTYLSIVPIDGAGRSRPNPPSIGAYEP